MLRANEKCRAAGGNSVWIVGFVFLSLFDQNGGMRECERQTHERKTVCGWVRMFAWVRARACRCLGVCWAFYVHCMVPCPCQASHTDQTLSLNGSAGWRGQGREAKKKKKNDWSPLSWQLCLNVPWFYTRCVPWACTGFNTQRFIPQILSLPQSVSSFSKVHPSSSMHTRENKWHSRAWAARRAQFYLQTT